MRWLSSPKVRLGLIVNGLYFISLFTPAAPHTRPRLFPRAQENYETRAAARRPPVLPPLPSPSTPTKAATYVARQFDQLDVYLTNDFTLVNRPDHRLLLSPTFTTRASKPEPPDSILLRFISFSGERTFSNFTPLIITADGENKLDERAHLWYGGGGVPGGEGDPVVEGLGVELPYEVFLEILSARQVIIQLGPDRVELSAEQIEALRDMHRRVAQQIDDPPPPPRTAPADSYGVGRAPVVIQAPPAPMPPDRRY
jgi:hypothetical protein